MQILASLKYLSYHFEFDFKILAIPRVPNFGANRHIQYFENVLQLLTEHCCHGEFYSFKNGCFDWQGCSQNKTQLPEINYKGCTLLALLVHECSSAISTYYLFFQTNRMLVRYYVKGSGICDSSIIFRKLNKGPKFRMVEEKKQTSKKMI